jgi:hypothetical protein
MPTYRVLVEGGGFEFPGTQGDVVRGFVVVKVVAAASKSEAESIATARVFAEWRSGRYASLNVKPALSVSEVERLGFVERLRASETGYVFHPGDEANG